MTPIGPQTAPPPQDTQSPGTPLSRGANRRVLLPFSDDSTLFFADRMRSLLADSGIATDIAWLATRTELTARQLSAILPKGPDVLLRPEAFHAPEALARYDAILTSRIFPPLRDMLRAPLMRHRADRPAVLAFQGGLEFDPERGFFNRRYADGVFVVPAANKPAYLAWTERMAIGGAQYVGVGHPAFLSPSWVPDGAQVSAAHATALLAPQDSTGDLYFFAQAISPLSYGARRHMVDVLAALAKAHPDRNIWIKLRHLPGENATHIHQEQYPYPDILRHAGADGLPNLHLTAEPMEAVLPRVGLGLTCTSTAAVDLIRAGVPTMVYLDYVEHYLDPLAAPMRTLFDTSGLIVTLDQLLALSPGTPHPDWMASMLTDRDHLIAQIHAAIDHFQGRADVVAQALPDWNQALTG